MSSGRNRAKCLLHTQRNSTAPHLDQEDSCSKIDAAGNAISARQLNSPGRPAGRQSMPPMPSPPTDNSGEPLFAEEPIDTDSAHSQRSTRSAFKVRALASKGIRSRKTVRLRHRTNRPVTNSSKPALSRLHRAPEDALVCSDLALLEPRWPRGPTAVFLEREAGR